MHDLDSFGPPVMREDRILYIVRCKPPFLALSLVPTKIKRPTLPK